MTYEFRSNGQIEIRMRAADLIETAYFAAIIDAVNLGRTVCIRKDEEGIVLSVERS